MRRGLSIAVMLTTAFLLAATGCGSSGTHPVHGRVVLKEDGKPLTGGMVIFEPADESLKVNAHGSIQKDGSYRLSTYQDGDGAPPGRYRVLVVPPPPANPDRPPPPPFHPRFGSLEKSPLEFTVTPGRNEYNITVEKQ